MTFTWTGLGAGSATFTLNTGHTVTITGGTGILVTWATTKATTIHVTGIQLTFHNGGFYDCYTNYDAVVSGTSMSGLQQTDGLGSTSCLAHGTWSAVRTAAPLHRSGAGNRVAGVR